MTLDRGTSRTYQYCASNTALAITSNTALAITSNTALAITSNTALAITSNTALAIRLAEADPSSLSFVLTFFVYLYLLLYPHRDEAGRTPLMTACSLSAVDTVEVLLGAGADEQVPARNI